MTNTNTASFIRPTFAAVTACLITTACSTGVQIQVTAPTTASPPSLKNMPAPDAVLELIQRVMKAAKTGVLMNEEVALKTLGLIMVPSTKPGSTRQIITGIAALDDDEEVRVYYGVNRDPARPQTWGVSIDLYNDVICIRKENVEKIFGTTTDNFIFPLHDNKAFGGIYYYTVRRDSETSRASFRYVNRDSTGRCLSQFSIQPTTR